MKMKMRKETKIKISSLSSTLIFIELIKNTGFGL